VTGGAEAGAGVPPADPAALARAVAALLGDPERRSRLGRAGRERARKLFDVEIMVRAYENLYAEVLAPRRRAE
jgi:glycosyltransferase involved in cell wall biosynthesis